MSTQYLCENWYAHRNLYFLIFWKLFVIGFFFYFKNQGKIIFILLNFICKTEISKIFPLPKCNKNFFLIFVKDSGNFLASRESAQVLVSFNKNKNLIAGYIFIHAVRTAFTLLFSMIIVKIDTYLSILWNFKYFRIFLPYISLQFCHTNGTILNNVWC